MKFLKNDLLGLHETLKEALYWFFQGFDPKSKNNFNVKEVVQFSFCALLTCEDVQFDYTSSEVENLKSNFKELVYYYPDLDSNISSISEDRIVQILVLLEMHWERVKENSYAYRVLANLIGISLNFPEDVEFRKKFINSIS